MKAIVYRRYGPPDVLQLEDMPKPTPKDNEILINVRAAEVTKADCEMRSFRFPVKWFWLPLRLAMGLWKPRRPVLGGYFAGTVEAVGREVSAFAEGDAIFGSAQLRLGCYAQYLCLPANYTLVRKPDNITFEEAAAVPLGGLNALHFMTLANIKPGERVLINGAGGSIGVLGVQIAKAMGAVVTAVDSAKKESMLRGIGADDFVDYAREDFNRSGAKYDVIFSMVAKTSFSRCLASLKPGGRYLMANPRISDMLRSAWVSKRTGKSALFAFAKESRDELLKLSQMLETGTLKAVVDKVYPMEQVVPAHKSVESEQRLGSIVISIHPVNGSD